MAAEPYRCCYTWPVTEGVAGKEITLQKCDSSCPDFAPIDELLDLDKCLVLNGSDGQDSCEMRLSVIPLYLPRAISLVVECPVIECYHGQLNEYYKTYHGELVYTLGGVKVFRFDIRIMTDIDELQLKFITPKSDPLCLYGTRLYLARNPNPLQSAMLRGKRINPVVVQHRLQETNLSEKAEKCKRLVLGSMQTSEHNITNNNNIQPHSPPARTHILPDTTAQDDPDSNLPNLFSGMLLTGNIANSSVLEMFMKQYIDSKFTELEQMVDNKLASMESRQNEKFDKILALLQEQTISRHTSNQPYNAVE